MTGDHFIFKFIYEGFNFKCWPAGRIRTLINY